MRLESALFTSRSGIDTHGRAIAVVGDNIANVSTTGFKGSRSEFGDIFAEGGEGRRSWAGPAAGNGVMLRDVIQLHEQGTNEVTGRELDAAVAGKGFFVLGSPEAPEYTRAGDFSVASDGTLVGSGGKPVLGFSGDAATLGPLNLNNVQTASAATTAASLSGNLRSDAPIVALPTAAPATFNELARSATSLVTMTAYDSLGAARSTTVAFWKTGNNTWKAQAYMDGGDVGGTAGAPVALGAPSDLVFGADGRLAEAAKAAATVTAAPAYAGGAAAGAFTIDLGSFTQYAAPTELLSITQDGKGTGQIDGYEFGRDGSLFAVLDSGDRAKIGTVALAGFANVGGLGRAGSGTFVDDGTAGTPVIGRPGDGANGTLDGGALERSTVDMSNEFVNLILLQRGYQANSQTLSATSDLLRDTIALIR